MQHQDRGSKPSPERRASIYARDGHCCAYCGCDVHPGAPTSDPQAATLDHLVCFSAGGTWATENLVTACFECNRARADARLQTWIAAACAVCGLEAHAARLARAVRRQARRPL